eukprot:TRINITY_DN15398_c0_g1_i2.p1 TRINITY_DN15398_c0_g1~~TRINITY_DN15398_c0_g1_i2.p1  ORF type:complete len:108 (+),score=29.95 TRINITY_DN15398_c0_g1_i2:166-489(+)
MCIRDRDLYVREAFDKIDTNKSGFIEKNELGEMLNKLAQDMEIQKPNQEDIDEAMQAIDINQDGKVSFDEYKNCLLYTSDAADEEDSVDLGGRRIFKKKNQNIIDLV